jgi:hypothetical protein
MGAHRPAWCICNVSFPTWRVAKHGCCFLELLTLLTCELRRIPLLRGWVNKGKKKTIGRSLTSPGPAAFSAANRYSVASCTMKLPFWKSTRTIINGH